MGRSYVFLTLLVCTFCSYGNPAAVRESRKADEDDLIKALERLDHLLSSFTADANPEVEEQPNTETEAEAQVQGEQVEAQENYKRMGDGPMPYKRFGDGPMPYKRMGDGPVPYKRMGDGPMPYKRMGDGPMPYKRMGDGPMPYKRMGDGPMPYKRVDDAYPAYESYPGYNGYYPDYSAAERPYPKDLSLREVMRYLQDLEKSRESRDHDIPFPSKRYLNEDRP